MGRCLRAFEGVYALPLFSAGRCEHRDSRVRTSEIYAEGEEPAT